MRLCDYLDKGASLDAEARCLSTGGASRTYRQVQETSWLVARALKRAGVRPGDKVAVLANNDALAFCFVFGISRAGAVWCPINPRNTAGENRQLLAAFDCVCLVHQRAFAPQVAQIRAALPALTTVVCLEGSTADAVSFAAWSEGLAPDPIDEQPVDDLAMIVAAAGSTSNPKGAMLTCRNLETMTAIALMAYPYRGRPVYLALYPLTQPAGVFCLPILALGGEVVILPKPDLGAFLETIAVARVTHTFLPPPLIYTLLAHPRLSSTNLESLQCFWYGAAPMSAERLEEALQRIGPVMAQLFGQSEVPMMISTLSPAEHFRADGTVARERLASVGKPAPLVTVAIMSEDGQLLATGERGEIVVRGPLVMAGYYKNEEATREVGRHGWHHTGDIGYLDADGYLFIVDRDRDLIVSGGCHVYSVEVEQVLMQYPAIQECAVVGLPDAEWGERVTAVIQLKPYEQVELEALKTFVKMRIGSAKTPRQIEVWPELPRSKVAKVLKREIRERLLKSAG